MSVHSAILLCVLIMFRALNMVLFLKNKRTNDLINVIVLVDDCLLTINTKTLLSMYNKISFAYKIPPPPTSKLQKVLGFILELTFP